MTESIELESIKSPIGVMRDLVPLIGSDPEKFLHHRGFKRQRESWVVAMTLVGIVKLTGDCWFMRMVSEDEDPPDAVAVKFRLESGGKGIQLEVPVEVVFVPEYVRSQSWNPDLSPEKNVYNVLVRTKFDSKCYAPETNLFVYLNLPQQQFRLDLFSSLIAERKPSLGGVWLLGSISTDGEEYLLHQAYPQISQCSLSLSEVLDWPKDRLPNTG
jgi:hypothetical protein